MSIRSRIDALSRWQKGALVSAILVAIHAAVGFVALPPLVRNIAIEELNETFRRGATVGDVRINPFLLTLDVERFVLPDRDGSPFVQFDAFHADFELSSIWHGAFTFREVRLVAPFVHVKILEDGALNFGDMIEIMLADDGEEPQQEEGATPSVLVHLAAIESGRLVFSDRSRPTHFEHEIAPLDIEMRDFGTRPDDEAPYSFAATTGAGETLEWEGSVSVVPLYSHGRLSLTGVRPRTGWLYVQDDVLFEVEDGTVDVEARYDIDAREGLQLRLDEGFIRIRDFVVADRETGQPAVSIQALDVNVIELAYPELTLSIDSIEANGGRHHMLRIEDGQLRASQLAVQREADGAPTARGAERADVASTTPPAPAEPARPSTAKQAGASPPQVPDAASADGTQVANAAASSAPPDEWTVTVARVTIVDHRVDFEDRSTDPPITLTIAPVALELTGVSSDLTKPVHVDLDVGFGEEGSVHLEGPVRAEPPRAELSMQIAAFDLRPFEPYWLPTLDVDLTSGSLTLEGRLLAELGEAGAPAVEFHGRTRIDRLRALDRTLGSKLVSWETLELIGLDLDTSPPSLALDRLVLGRPAVHVMLAADGSTNLSHVVVDSGDAPASTPAPAPGEPVPVSIGTVKIVGAAATFEDRTVQPTFRTGVSKLDGEVTGLSSERAKRARVDLAGRLDGATPVAISGVVSPLAEQTYVDLRLSFENYDLTPLTPYTGRHIGQTIARGKLFIDVEYVLDGDTIRGENELFLDQFTLGDKVDSPDALNLPVGLAIALIKDRNGEIHIDLPVSGEVDDPEFSVGKLVFGALGNLITKVALSPFAMLGGLGAGEGDERQSVGFAAGQSQLDAEGASMLDKLATALVDRPGLALELTGGAVTEVDRPALQAAALDLELRRERMRELQSRWFGDKPESVEEVVLEPKERRRLVEDRFETLYGVDPEPGVSPPFPPERAAELATADPEARIAAWQEILERRVAERIEIGDDALRDLARQRSRAVRAHVVEAASVEPERIFMLEPVVDGVLEGGSPATLLSLAAH